MTQDNSIEYRRAFNGRHMDKIDILEVLKDLVNLNRYENEVSISQGPGRTSVPIDDEIDLWRLIESGEVRHGDEIVLVDFHLMEWLPLSPGLYFTKAAVDGRRLLEEFLPKAVRSVNGNEDVNTFLGKEVSIIRGVGSLRLASTFQVSDKVFHWLGATSSGKSHCGIPVAVPSCVYTSVLSDVRRLGAVRMRARGKLVCLPSKINFQGSSTFVAPRFLKVDSIEKVDMTGNGNLLVSLVIMFSSRYDWLREHSNLGVSLSKQWAFDSFDPSEGESALESASAWLWSKAIANSREPSPMILSDFDERVNHFRTGVEFSLHDLTHGQIELARLRAYGSFYGERIQVEELVAGKNFRRLHNSPLIKIKRLNWALKVLRSSNHNLLVEALVNIADEIVKQESVEASEVFDCILNEILSAGPRHLAIRAFWSDLVCLLPSTFRFASNHLVLVPQEFGHSQP